MLAVDVGNSFTRIVAFKGDGIGFRRTFPTSKLDRRELENTFRQAAEHARDASVWVASVAPDANAAVSGAAEQARLGVAFIKPGSDDIIPHTLSTPATTGADRLLSALAAGRRHFAGGAGAHGYVVAQCGSAATIDYVDAEGRFRGGYIIPGPRLWLSGLAEAAMLPDLAGEPLDWTRVLPGDNTRDALLNGMHMCLPTTVATATMMVYMPDRLPGETEPRPPVAVTGGWGEAATPYIAAPFVYDADLVLHGIRLFAERHIRPRGNPR